ncbi:hypothetical protein ABES58_33180 [Paenibacillus lautus]|uniref:hypothetical protein n=1 Tax=Paenibacillus lautus TaxID=1401 RepID=UPI003D2CA831
MHCNAGGGAGGLESFRYTNVSAASRSLQNVLHTKIMAALKPYHVIDRGQKAANLHMVYDLYVKMENVNFIIYQNYY